MVIIHGNVSWTTHNGKPRQNSALRQTAPRGWWHDVRPIITNLPLKAASNGVGVFLLWLTNGAACSAQTAAYQMGSFTVPPLAGGVSFGAVLARDAPPSVFLSR